MILIVDDDDLHVQLFEVLLRSRGLRVRAARSVREARAALASEQPEVILMDVEMPEVDGLEFTRELKSHPGTAHLTVVAVTAYAAPEYAERARRAGCDGLITKPVNPRTFTDEVERFIRARAASCHS